MNCQHCFSEIQTKICYCPECGFPYHEDCWKKNNSKCVQYGCKGKTGVLENSDDKKEETEVKEEVLTKQTNNLNEVTFRSVDKSKNNQQNIIYVLIGVIFLLVISMFYFNNSNKKIPIESAKKIETNIPINESIKKIETIKSENNLKIEVTSTPYKEQESIKKIEINKNENTSLNNKNVLLNNTIFKGSIDNNIKFHINLTRNGNNISGLEYYDLYKENININGEIDNENNFILYEVAQNNSEIKFGVFRGNLVGNNLSGIWSKIDGSNKKSFFATVSTETETFFYKNNTNRKLKNSNTYYENTPKKEVINKEISKINNSEKYFTLQVASKSNSNDAFKISEQIPNSFIARKIVKGIKRYVVVIGKFQNRDEAQTFKNTLISNYGRVGSEDDVSKAFIVNMSELIFD